MKITGYIKKMLGSEKTPSDTSEALANADHLFKTSIADTVEQMLKHDIVLNNREAIYVDGVISKALGLKHGFGLPQLKPHLMKTGKACHDILLEMEKISRKKSDMSDFLYSPQGAFIDRAGMHMEFICSYYIDICRFVMAKEINVGGGLADAPVFADLITGRASQFALLLKFYSETRDIQSMIRSIPDISIPTDQDIETASAVYKPGVLDPMIASGLRMVFFPVRMAFEARAEMRARRYKNLRNKLEGLELMIVSASSEDPLPGVEREIASLELRIKEAQMEMHEMEVQVGIK